MKVGETKYSRMNFIGWIEVRDSMYAVMEHKGIIHVQKYVKGNKVIGAVRTYDKSTFKDFLEQIRELGGEYPQKVGKLTGEA